MNLPRTIEPEWLDELPAENPRAMRSRRDLARVNRWMLQANIMARCLMAACDERTPRTLVDLGAGDGTFMLALARRLGRFWPSVQVILLDRQNIITENTRAGFRALGWDVECISADVFDFLDSALAASADLVCANLFLHHFQPEQIARLFAGVAAIGGSFVACEPRRARLALIGSRLLRVIGCNDVTRHDAVASVRAGFSNRDLTELWPAGAWQLREAPAFPFTHCFSARPPKGARV